jgi:phosphatidylglycerol:prolipoprotein diacylglycerol transferase
VILGGRLGYVLFYKPAYYLSHPAEILAVWQGGMAFHGGFLGVLVAMWLFGRKTDRPWLAVTDFIAPWCPWGRRAPGQLHQRRTRRAVTDVPWAMVFPRWTPCPATPPSSTSSPWKGQPVPDPVVVLGQTPPPRPDLRRLPDRLRRLPLHRRVRPRARRLPRPAHLRHVHGPVAVLPMILAGVAMAAWASRRQTAA